MFFHPSCVPLQFRQSNPFICPLHCCSFCREWEEEQNSLLKCIYCCKSYHKYCLPLEVFPLSSRVFICASHRFVSSWIVVDCRKTVSFLPYLTIYSLSEEQSRFRRKKRFLLKKKKKKKKKRLTISLTTNHSLSTTTLPHQSVFIRVLFIRFNKQSNEICTHKYMIYSASSASSISISLTSSSIPSFPIRVG